MLIESNRDVLSEGKSRRWKNMYLPAVAVLCVLLVVAGSSAAAILSKPTVVADEAPIRAPKIKLSVDSNHSETPSNIFQKRDQPTDTQEEEFPTSTPTAFVRRATNSPTAENRATEVPTSVREGNPRGAEEYATRNPTASTETPTFSTSATRNPTASTETPTFSTSAETESPTTAGSPAGPRTNVEESIPIPFANATLQPFSKNVLQGYKSLKEIEKGLTELLQVVIRSIILKNIEDREAWSNPTTWDDDEMAWEDDTPLEDKDADEPGIRFGPKKLSETNTREESVDEGDLIKTDGQYVYAFVDGGHYGSPDLLVWNTEGSMITRVERNRTSKIHAILPTTDHVAVVFEDYNYADNSFCIMGTQAYTKVEVYTKPTAANPVMKLVGTKSINGYYLDSLWLHDSNSIHIVTSSQLCYNELVESLAIYHFPWLSKLEYAEAATNLAKNRLIPKVVRTFSRELSSTYDDLPTMLQFNTWTTDGDIKLGYDPSVYGDILKKYLLVTSIKTNGIAPDGLHALKTAATLFMTPDVDLETVYGSGKSLIISFGRVWDYQYHLNTTLFKLDVVSNRDRADLKFHSLVTLEGRLANENRNAKKYSIDLQGNDLRVATTSFNRRADWQKVQEICGYQYDYSQCMPDEAWVQCEAAVNSCAEVVKEGCPYVSTCADGSPVLPPSSVWNEIVVLDTTQGGDMVELGRARFGEPEHLVFAVHFTQNFSYAVTFEQADPFYVLNLEAGKAPHVTGVVKPEGYYMYLHPLNEDATMLVGVGQDNLDVWYGSAGLMVIIFDATDPKSPKTIANYTVDVDFQEGRAVYIDSPKAIQYDNVTGKLAVPATVSSHYFDGFIVFDVHPLHSEEKITELYWVNHTMHSDVWCANSNPDRSFIFAEEEIIMTFADCRAIGSDLNSGSPLWNVSLIE